MKGFPCPCLVFGLGLGQDKNCISAHAQIYPDINGAIRRSKSRYWIHGHCNAISCLAVTGDRDTIITADAGRTSLMVLWSATSGAPLVSIAEPHKHGVLALDLSPDDEWLATISAPDPETGEQEVGVTVELHNAMGDR
eukprot:365274-Chlamydomonas_euryale.AAC.10